MIMDTLPLLSTSALPEAPTGAKEGAVIPVVFGEQKVEGKLAFLGVVGYTDDATKLSKYGDMEKGYIATAWYIISSAIKEVIRVFANDKILKREVDYDAAHLSKDGDFTPAIEQRGAIVIAGGAGKCYATTDKITWLTRTIGTTDAIYCSCVRGDTYLLGSINGNIYLSYDTYNWRKLTGVCPPGTVRSICWGTDKFVAVCNLGRIYTSPTGEKWTARTSGTINDLCGVAHNGQVFVAVGASRKMLYSYDGITWNAVTSFTPDDYSAADLYGICFGGLFVAVGGVGVIWTSTDGIHWSFRQRVYYDLYCTACNAKVILAAGQSGHVFYSIDSGMKWTEVALATGSIRTIIYDGRLFWVAGDSSPMFYSQFGYPASKWTSMTNPIGASGTLACIVNLSETNFAYFSQLNGLAHILFHAPEAADKRDTRIVCDSSGRAPDMKFLVQGSCPLFAEDTHPLFAEDTQSLYKYAADLTTPVKYLGANPAAVLYEIMANKQWGLGIAPALINKPTFEGIANYFAGTGLVRAYGLNFTMDSITTAREVFDKIREMTDVFVSWEPYGGVMKFRCKNLYNPSTADVDIDDDDLISCNIKTQSWDEIYNSFEGEYTEPDLNYEKRSIYAKNEASIAMTDGRIKKKKIDLTWFIDQDVASARLHEIMQRESVPRVAISCAAGHKLAVIKPGDLVQFDSDEYNLHGKYTAIQVSIGELNDLTVNVDLQPAYENMFDNNFVSVMSAQMVSPPTNGEALPYQTIDFPKHSYLSGYRTGAFTNISNSRVKFRNPEALSLPTSILTYGTDYNIINGGTDTPQIQLTARWKSIVESNSTGTLSIYVWEV